MPFSYQSIRMPTRKTHKARKNWAVIDVELFARLMQEGRAKGVLPKDHDGKCLYILEPAVRIATAFGAYTEKQARLYAANGGNWAALELLKRNGQRFERKYRDQKRFIVVELRVLGFMREMASITWDLHAVRLKMFELFGERILSSLCTTFDPFVSTLEQERAKARREQRELDRRSGEKERPRPTARKTPLRTYRIIDLDDFRFRRAEALQKAVDAGAALEEAKTHEGALMKRATFSAEIQASSWKTAIDSFRLRVQGAFSVLAFDRFIALARTEWEQLVEASSLPAIVRRDTLRQLLRSLPKKRKEKAGVFPDKDWWRKYEAGCDDGQYALVPLFTENELFEFPPKAGRPKRQPLVRLTPAMRAWRPNRRKCRRMKQLHLRFRGESRTPLPLRMVDADNPQQFILFHLGNRAAPAPKTRGRWQRRQQTAKYSQMILPLDK